MSNWRKSTRSKNYGDCVEVGAAAQVLVRDTAQAGRGPVLAVGATAWRVFLSRVRRSEQVAL